ncbi:alpha-L-fucosidase [Prevotella pallens]|uniref:alpha-L-fucosidase n=1 Tax=Prevotella pallens TaxID=60133 RepID=UPI0028E3AB09|nr:alpha-L-fucosidase [Prevotella pallens]
MKRLITTSLLAFALTTPNIIQIKGQEQVRNNQMKISQSFHKEYVPTAENIAARKRFEGFRFGIFLHWGIYSTFAQGEWYLNNKINKDEYAKAASAFYPSYFDANAWIKAIKDSGAKYITFTSRHHDSFSMFKTKESNYNIVDATPFKRDVLKELANACHQQNIDLHIYYSILDWIREDYPIGRTGLYTGRNLKPNYDSYFNFMKGQISELLHNYGKVGAIWLDGYWDHDSDSIPFDWRMEEFYRYIHSIQPACLIGNNHHIAPINGEDFQMFERDLPGENKAGLSGQAISHLPLEACQTMNGMWGYKVSDIDYKSTNQLIELLVRSAAKGSNLLLNIGPQPNGELPALALDRLQGIGKWMQKYGATIYETMAGNVPEYTWGVSTSKGKKTYLHVLKQDAETISFTIPIKPKYIIDFLSHKPLPYNYNKKTKVLNINIGNHKGIVDYVVELEK